MPHPRTVILHLPLEPRATETGSVHLGTVRPESDDHLIPDPWAEGTPLPRARTMSRGTCPRCRAPLSQRIAGELDLDQCLDCAGVFVSDVAMTQLLIGELDGPAALLALSGQLPGKPIGPSIAWCPSCAQPMGARPIAGARVLVCRAHGAWIDHAHLTSAAEALARRAPDRVGELERAAFRDLAERRRWSVILGHARALGSRTRGAVPRGSVGLLADLFG